MLLCGVVWRRSVLPYARHHLDGLEYRQQHCKCAHCIAFRQQNQGPNTKHQTPKQTTNNKAMAMMGPQPGMGPVMVLSEFLR